MSEAREPFAFQALLYGTRDRGTYPTLAALAEKMMEKNYPADWVEVWEFREGGDGEMVAPERYSEPDVPARWLATSALR